MIPLSELFYILGPGLSPLHIQSVQSPRQHRCGSWGSLSGQARICPGVILTLHPMLLSALLRAALEVHPAKGSGGWGWPCRGDFKEEVRLEAINQTKRYTRRWLFLGVRWPIGAFHRVQPSSAIKIEASKITSETQQAGSDLWSWPLPSLDSHRGPWECRWRNWPAKFCSRTSSYQQVLSSPLILSQEWMKSSEQVAWIRGREWRWFDWRLFLAGLFHLLPSLLKIVSSVT